MIVYELRHTIYVWEECDTTVNTLIFETEEDAIEYLETKKMDLVDEYCKELNLPFSLNTLHQYLSQDDGTYSDITDEETYFYVEIEEYGFDRLEITKKEVLRFN